MLNRNKNSHYDSGKWVDFARGLVKGHDRDNMQAHLDTGCTDCREVAVLFSRIVERAKADASYEVPEHVAKNARALYSLQRPEEVRLLPRTIARLVFDSFREPLLAGVRSQQCVAHQLMYVAGPYCVDLRLEREGGATYVRLIGQIANRESEEKGVSEVPVFLLSGDSVVTKTATNKFGEFAIDYAPRTGLKLFAPIPGENHIEIRLGAASSADIDRVSP